MTLRGSLYLVSLDVDVRVRVQQQPYYLLVLGGVVPAGDLHLGHLAGVVERRGTVLVHGVDELRALVGAAVRPHVREQVAHLRRVTVGARHV